VCRAATPGSSPSRWSLLACGTRTVVDAVLVISRQTASRRPALVMIVISAVITRTSTGPIRAGVDQEIAPVVHGPPVRVAHVILTPPDGGVPQRRGDARLHHRTFSGM
jgi:hypothetical protein